MAIEGNEPFKIPPELEKPTPRVVRRRRGSLGCLMVFFRLFFLPFMIFGAWLLLVLAIRIATVLWGGTYEARIVQKWTTRHDDGSSTYQIRYAFTSDGIERIDDRTVSQREYEQLPGGDAADVSKYPVKALRVMGSYFSSMRLPRETWWSPVLRAFRWALDWNVWLAFFVNWLWIAPWREKRLYRWGKPVVGRIIEGFAAVEACDG